MLTANQFLVQGRGLKLSMPGIRSLKVGGRVADFGAIASSLSTKVHAHISGDSLKLSNAAWFHRNATYIGNETDSIAIGWSRSSGILISDNFSGCDFAVLRDPQGTYAGAHVYSNDDCRGRMADLPVGWTEICTWPSRGYMDRWPGITGLMAFAFTNSVPVRILIAGIAGYPPAIREIEEYLPDGA